MKKSTSNRLQTHSSRPKRRARVKVKPEGAGDKNYYEKTPLWKRLKGL